MQPTSHPTVPNGEFVPIIHPDCDGKLWLYGLPLYLGLAVTALVCVLLALRAVGLAGGAR